MKKTYKLIESLSKGDEKAFDVIFMNYFPRLRFFIAGIVADDNEAQNIAQDIFYNLWQNREKLAAVQNFNAYIFRIAKNAALNHIERNTLHDNYIQKQLQKQDYLHVDNADEILIAAQMQDTLTITIDKMPPQRKEIFKMSRIDGMSNEDIAHQLSISKRTVETHISAALSDLRKVVSREKVN